MTILVCLLEELSAKEMLKIILPKILNDTIQLQFITFEGKQDLEKQLVNKLKHWNKPDTKFLIMRDKDLGDCIEIKKQLLAKVTQSGKTNASLVRIACHELESFYLGDLKAIEEGLSLKNIGSQTNKKYKNPDNLPNAKQELKRITKQRYQQVSGSKSIAPFLKIDGSNKSHSFNILLSGIKQITQ